MIQRIALALLLACQLAAVTVHAAPTGAIDHVEPPFWWTAMHEPKLQLLVHGEAIGALSPSLSWPGVQLDRVTRTANPNYLFLDLTVDAGARPGAFEIVFKDPAGGIRQRIAYRLLAREDGSAARASFGNADVIYQLMPDRFANGDPANDSVAGLADKLARANGGGRHGGDIAGIIDHLDYIARMGFTQLWPTPLLEINAPAFSYHGYAITDHYKVDPRYGSNADYRRLSDAARARGIGIIQDVVLSHVGAGHWWLQDPSASQADRRNFTQGWFGQGMPDLNQTNPLVANALIQNTIWWIEYARLSGLRIDTYGYSEPAFLTEFSRRVLAEYPRLNMVGEEWHKMPATVAH